MPHASYWDNPEDGGDDAPVVRHAPDNNNYHLPEADQTGKMRGSKVGRFATIPQANNDGTSKGFDGTCAGPVHVDPDAPDGGVIFDPNSVRKQDINRAVAQATYPHQAFYALGELASTLGVGRRKRAADANYNPPVHGGMDVDRGVNPHMPRSYVTPSAVQGGGQQVPVPNYAGPGYGGGQQLPNPLYAAQEAQIMNPIPPLNSLPPIHQPGGVVPSSQPPQQPPPVQVQAPQQYPQQPQYQQPPQQYPQPQPYPPPGYGYPAPYPQPPAVDPNIAALMAGMATMQQQIATIASAQQTSQRSLPGTTGVSSNPMPKGPPLRTTPVEEGGRTRRSAPAQDEEFDDTARPIRKQVKRKKGSQEIEDEESEEQVGVNRSLVRQATQAEEDEQPQTLKDYREHTEREPDGIIVGFESLNLPFVTGPIPQKAKKQVTFEIPNAGLQMARFHDVVESKECVVLVYDTRYEEGQQYIPPELGDAVIKLHVGKGKTAKIINVSSMGFTFAFGVFDMIVLVKHGQEPVDYDADAE